MQMLAGIPVSVDGKLVELAKTFTYKGMMYAGVPNLASSFGYINASWTLRTRYCIQGRPRAKAPAPPRSVHWTNSARPTGSLRLPRASAEPLPYCSTNAETPAFNQR